MIVDMNQRSGIAIAPILMVIALLGVIVAAFSMGGNSLGGAAITEDRTVAELRGQIDLIRTKIDECVMLTRQAAQPQFLYPGFDRLDTAILVKDLTCPRDPAGRQNLWNGARPAAYPPVTKSFMPWIYVNHGDTDTVSPGGICIKTQPVDAARANDQIIQASLRLIIRNFSTAEYTFDAATQSLIIWIKRPLSGTTC